MPWVPQEDMGPCMTGLIPGELYGGQQWLPERPAWLLLGRQWRAAAPGRESNYSSMALAARRIRGVRPGPPAFRTEAAWLGEACSGGKDRTSGPGRCRGR